MIYRLQIIGKKCHAFLAFGGQQAMNLAPIGFHSGWDCRQVG